MDLLTEEKLEKFLFTRLGNEQFCLRNRELSLIFKHFKDEIKTRDIKIVTVGGTNGKGETAHSLAYLLQKDSFSVALWTSPHIVTVRERFIFNGEMVPARELLVIFEKCWLDLHNKKVQLSYYEFLFYCFCELVLLKQVDILVLEVGLGGRFDAVNVFDPNLTAITSISRDHESILGRGHKKILFEKLGISREQAPLVTSLELLFCRGVTRKYCKQNKIDWVDIQEIGVVQKGSDFSLQNRTMAFCLKEILLSSYQEFRSKSDFTKLRFEISRTRFPMVKGRFEKILINSKNFLFVGSHNLDGIRKLFSLMKEQEDSYKGVYKVLVSFSKRPDWELKASLEILEKNASFFESIAVTSFDHPKAVQRSRIEGTISFVDNWQKYLEEECHCGDSILVMGSYYFIGEVQKYGASYR